MAARFPGSEYLAARKYKAEKEASFNPVLGFVQGYGGAAIKGQEERRKSAAEEMASEKKFGDDMALKLFDKYMPVRIANPNSKDISEKYTPVPASEYPSIIQSVRSNGNPPNDVYLIDISDYRTSKATAAANSGAAGAEARRAALVAQRQGYENAAKTATSEQDILLNNQLASDVQKKIDQLNVQSFGGPIAGQYEYQAGTPETKKYIWPFTKTTPAEPGKLVPKGQAQAPAATSTAKGTPPPFNGVVSGQKATKNGVTFIWDGTKWQ